MGSHTCHAEGCTVPVPPRMFACLRHWRMVPRSLQRALWAAYQPGQEHTKVVSALYLFVQARCRLAIAEREGRLVDAQRVRADLGAALRAGLAPDAEHKTSPDDVQIAGFDAALTRRFP